MSSALRDLGVLLADGRHPLATEIAKAFLVPVPTMAQRLVRAKRKIKKAGIPYQVPPTGLLALLDELGESGVLDDYYLFHAARADLLRRAGWFEEAAEAYAVALELAQNKVEKAFLRGRLEEMEGKVRDG